ncbi:hypothetical protein PUN28_010303 [Cardiocondyla obscurior]
MIFECLYQMVVTAIFLVKLLNQLLNYNKIQQLYETMETHWNIFTSDFEVQILKRYSHVAHQFTIFYSVMIYILAVMFITIPSLGPMLLDVLLPLNKSRPKNIATFTDYGVDQDEYFVPIFLYTSLMIVVGITILVATDTMHVSCTVHACGLFQIIGYEVENIISIARMGEQVNNIQRTKTGYERFTEKQIYQEYILCLKKHQLALEYVKVLNDTYKYVGISFTLLIGATFTLIGVRIVYVLDQIGELIKFAFIIMGAMLHLIIVCYTGQKLMNESENIFHRAYSAEWYNFSPRLKSLLVIFCHKSLVPAKVTAGNLFPLSMQVFATVVRTSGSYFTTLLSLKA